jgi:hypothetical protein
MALGLSVEDGVCDLADTEVWPENWKSLELFMALDTSWRYGMAGRTGIDYSVLPVLFDLHSVRPKDQLQVFQDIRVMESETLRLMAEEAKTRERVSRMSRPRRGR